MTVRKPSTGVLSAALSKREFLVRLVLAEVIARPGEGPLAPRFVRGPVRESHGEDPQETRAIEQNPEKR